MASNAQRKRDEIEQHNLKYAFCKEKWGVQFHPSLLNRYVKMAQERWPNEITWRKSW